MPDAEAAVLGAGLRPHRRRQAYLASGARVLMVELPGGVARAIAPGQEAGKPIRSWNYDFPLIRICTVIGPAGGDWLKDMRSLRVDGQELGAPMVANTGSSVRRTWTVPGFTIVSSIPTADGSELELTISRQPESKAELQRALGQESR